MNTESSTILIVDNVPDDRETLVALLANQAWRLAFAAGEPETLAAAARLKPDAILLDMTMRGVDALQVIRQLRSDSDLAAIPIVMITAAGDQATRLAGLGAGVDEFLAKPFDPSELLVCLATITRLSRYRRLLEERTRLAEAVELSPDAMLAVDPAGVIYLANPAFQRMLKIAEDPRGRAASLFSVVTSDHRMEWEECLRELCAGNAPELQFESVLVRTGGERVPVEVVGGPFSWQNRPAGLFVIRDITDRRRAELLEIERRQIASELHDNLAQMVTATHQLAQAVAHRYHPRVPAARQEVADLCRVARESVAEVRRVLLGLRPTALDDFGLATALSMQVAALRAEGWSITLDEDLGGKALPSTLETALYRVVQEGLNNVRKHAGTTMVHLELRRVGDEVRLVLQDWGRGFNSSSPPAKQLADLEQVLARKPDVIVSAPTDPVATADAYKKAAAQGVKLVFMDNVPVGLTAGKDYISAVSADNYGNGVAAALIAARKMNGKGKIGLIFHDADFLVTKKRYQGFKDTLTRNFPGIQIIAEQGIGGPDFAGNAEEAAGGMLTHYPDLNAIWAVWDVPAEGVMAAIRSFGRNDVQVYTEDLGKNVAIELARSGAVKGLGAQRPFDQGVTEAKLAAYGLLGKAAPPYVALNALPVTHDNVLDAWKAVYHQDPPAELVSAYVADAAVGSKKDKTFHSPGVHETTACSVDDVTLTDEEIAQVKAMRATAAIVLHYGGNDWSTAQVAGLKDEFARLGIEVIAVTDANFRPHNPTAGSRLGLRTMQDRIALVGGTFEIYSKPGAGTRLRVVVPISAGRAGETL